MAEKQSFKQRFLNFIDKHSRAIIAVQTFMILFFVTACTFHEAIPVCHYLFGCDHGMH
ncbi:MAG: hypothetical protein ACW99A_16375 [Candidatus Kariarchaeaceae archaeon]|jgi:hypothetical protein